MSVLIVEDGAFNAFCLARLLEAVFGELPVIVANHGSAALNCLKQNDISLIILDGYLESANEPPCNGPELANLIWSNYPTLPIIAWTDSETMRIAFAEIFKTHNKPFNDYSCWKKVISQDHIRRSFSALLSQSSNEHFVSNRQEQKYA